MLLVVPLSEMEKPLVVQLPLLKSARCCRINPVDGDGHEMTMLLPERKTFNVGALAVCMIEIKLQNPPVTEKFPPFIVAPAVGWPMLPVTENCPFVLVPPPLEI